MESSVLKRWLREHPWRFGLLVLALLITAPAIYVCLPHEYSRLEQLESSLNKLSEPGTQGAVVKRGLAELGISYNAWSQATNPPAAMKQGSEVLIAVYPGERALVSDYPTGAWQFPCEVRLRIFIVFDQHDLVARRYVRRHKTCP